MILTLLAVLLSLPAAGVPPQLVPVQVRIRAAGGEPIHEAYVALVPGWRPVHAPLAEKILRDGRGEFRVPEDTYRVIAGAKGYRVVTHGPLTFTAAAGGGKLDLTLEPLAEARGVVTDAEGNALAGVRVEDTRAAADPPFGGLSELAARLLSQDSSTVTDRQGSWKLRLPRGSVPIVFSANGRAAQFRTWKSTDPRPLDMAMPAGGALRVIADRADPAVMITLERDGAAPEGSIPRDWQRQLWARWATRTPLSWNSLPAGSYSIYAKYFDPAYMMQRAVKIGAATVPAMGAADVRVKLPPSLRKAGKIVRLYVEATALSSDDLEAYGVDERGAPRRVPALVQETSGGSVIHINGDAASGPFFAATSTQFFSAAAANDDPSAPAAIAVVRDRANAHADVRSAEEGVELPRGGTAVLRDCVSAKKGQSGAVSVPVEIRNGHTAQFIAPANCASAVLSLPPFEPILIPRPLHRGDQSLGEFALRAAASADVRVVTDGDAAVPGAVVRVLTQEPDAPMVVTEAKAGADGWAYIATLPVMRNIRVIALSPDGDPSDTREVRAEPREKVVVDPLRIPSPATLVVAAKLKASVRAAFPASQVRMIFLRSREMQPGDPQRQERVRDEAPVRFEHLKAGAWKVGAIVSVAGNDTFLDVDEIELKSGETRRLEKEIEPLVFSGRVTIGGQGLAARITLSNRSAASSVMPHFDSHADGSFYAILPDRGTYRVAVARLDAQQASIPAGDVDFDDPSRPVEIALPAMATVVVHVRARGEAVPNVLVSTSLQNAPLEQVVASGQLARADAKGDARFEQLLPGHWVFAVRENESGRGGEKPLAVREGERAEVTIELDERAARIEGSVRYASGQPVPQARVACYSIGPANLPARSAAETAADGRFTIQLAAKPAGPVLCSVVAPSGEIDAFTPTPDRPVVVQLPAATARLRISDWGRQYNAEVFWLAAPDGRAISLSAIAEALPRSGTSLELPALAAGRWKLIRLQSLSQWVALVGGQGTMLPGAEVTLQEGETESVSIYGKER